MRVPVPLSSVCLRAVSQSACPFVSSECLSLRLLSGFEQCVEYKVIKGAGHDMGDFFFVPSYDNSTVHP